jgi:hypothetical protein
MGRAHGFALATLAQEHPRDGGAERVGRVRRGDRRELGPRVRVGAEMQRQGRAPHERRARAARGTYSHCSRDIASVVSARESVARRASLSCVAPTSRVARWR